jgi:hypothetical protein
MTKSRPNSHAEEKRQSATSTHSYLPTTKTPTKGQTRNDSSEQRKGTLEPWASQFPTTKEKRNAEAQSAQQQNSLSVSPPPKKVEDVRSHLGSLRKEEAIIVDDLEHQDFAEVESHVPAQTECEARPDGVAIKFENTTTPPKSNTDQYMSEAPEKSVPEKPRSPPRSRPRTRRPSPQWFEDFFEMVADVVAPQMEKQ